MYITELQSNILEKLAFFKYLTNEMLADLLQKEKNYLSNWGTATLVARELIGVHHFAVHPKKGRLPNIYFLKPKGVKLLIEDLQLDKEGIKYPKGQNIFSKDYFHRIETINTHIGVYNFIQKNQAELLQFETYYDKTGSLRNQNEMADTQLHLPNQTTLVPDIITKYELQGKKYLLLIEVYKGKDTKRIITQVRKLIYAIYNAIPSKKYKFDKSARLMLLFENDSIKNATIERIKTDEYLNQYEQLEKCIFSKNLDSIRETFGEHWQTIDNKIVNLSSF